MTSRLGTGVIIEGDVILGADTLVNHYSILRPGVRIGDRSEVRQFCYIAAGAIIGSDCKIFQYANIGAGSVIEDKVYIGPKVVLTNTRKIAHMRDFKPEIAPVAVKRGARIGTGAIILPGVVIGVNAVVGAGSVVTKDVPEGEVWAGNPARKIGFVPESEFL